METKSRVEQLYSGKYKSSLKAYQKKSISDYTSTKTNPVQVKSEAIRAIQPKGLQRELFDYQKTDLGFIESRNGRCILGHEPGLGKTGMALAYLQLHPETRPAIIICPSSLKLNWSKEVFLWTEKRKENEVYILSGKTKRICEEVSIKGSGRLILTPCKLPKTGIFIINYEGLPNQQTKLIRDGKVVTKDGKPVMIDIPDTGWIDSLHRLNAEIILTDESQYLKSRSAARTKAVMSLAKGVPKNIAMTGTLIENRPAEAYNVINMINPQLFPSRWKFCQRYCDPKHNGFGWDFNGASNTLELHQKISNISIRRLKADVLKDLPDKIRVVVPLELDNLSEYSKAEIDLISWLKVNKGLKKAEQASKVEALARINELKQLSAKGKMESALDWIESYLSEGGKLVVFAVNTFVLDAVQDAFPDCSVRIDGSVTGTKRNDAVEAFQSDKRIKLMIGNIQAAGVGLTLTAAAATCFLQLGWNNSVHIQAEDRVHRIGQTADSVTAYYLIANNTIENDILNIIDKKAAVVTAILDGKETEESENLFNILMDELSK